MHIAIISQTFYPAQNGQAVFAYNLAKGLSQYGHKVFVITSSNDLKTHFETHKNFEIVRIASLNLSPFYPSVNITFFPRRMVFKYLSEFNPDIIHVQDHYMLSFSSLYYVRYSNTPTVGTNHFLPENLFYNMPIPYFIKGITERFLWGYMLFLYNKLAFVTAPTETAINILREQGIKPKVAAISCGIELDKFYPLKRDAISALKKEYGFNPDSTLFMYLGRVDREKGLDTVLKAIKLINRNDIRFVIAGKGLYMRELMAMVRRLGLEDKVKFLGFVPSQEVNRVLNVGDVFIMPSTAELQSIATLEAMATSHPLILARARALLELVDNRVNGYLFPPGDEKELSIIMQRLKDRPKEQKKMSKINLKKVQRHSLSNTIAKYISLYRQFV